MQSESKIFTKEILLDQKGLLTAAVFGAFLFGFSSSAHATSILDIARNFVNKIDRIYSGELQISPLEQIPDGGTLLLKPRSQKIFYADDIYAIKKNNKLYLSFEDVINILEFPIDFNISDKTADGWFLREDWRFRANFKDLKVVSKNVPYDIAEDDFFTEDNELFIEGQILAKWLDLSFDYDVRDQIINIESPFPLPTIARNLRQRRHGSGNYSSLNKANLPRLNQEKKNFEINTGDVSLSSRYSKSQSGATSTSQNANVVLEGEVLKHNQYLFMSGDSNVGIQNIVTRFTKRSEAPTLLGSLKARSYAFGDIDVVSLPLTGNSSQDLGFRFDNNKLENTDFAQTDLEGDAVPDWDIELYRNDILISTQTVDQSGRYRFENIQLFIGDNDFELFFYGPQGEIRSERLSVPVSQELLASKNNTYEVSVSFEDTQTLQSSSGVDSQDRNTPHIAARYNKLIGRSLGFVGFNTNQIDGERKLFLSGGLSSALGQTLIDTNFATDEAGEVAGEMIARRRIAGWDVSVNSRANTKNYLKRDEVDTPVFNLGFNAQRLIQPFGMRTNLLASGLYLQTASGAESNNYTIGLSNNFRGIIFSNSFKYDKDKPIDGEGTETYDHTFSARKSIGKYFLRMGTNYEIAPAKQLKNYFAQINYRYNNKFSGDLSYDRGFVTGIDTARLNLNYTHEKFVLSSFFQQNSDNNFIAGLNLKFSLTKDPQSPFPRMGSNRYVGRGALSAFVYNDKNGNMIFDGEDEPLEDAIVESVNYKRRARTNATGYASINDLSTTKATDIIVDPEGLPDFMMSATKGNSILPDAGSVYNLEFPVHLTGEVEGYVYALDEDGEETPASFQTMVLTSIENSDQEPIISKTERDGYYVIFNIPPGKYILNTAEKNNRGNDIPQYMTIGYDGTIIKDIDFTLIKDRAYVPYEVSFLENGIGLQRYIKIKEKGASDLSETLSEYLEEKESYKDLYQGLKRIKNVTDETGEYRFYSLKSSNGDRDATLHKTCQDIRQSGGQCSIIIKSTKAAVLSD